MIPFLCSLPVITHEHQFELQLVPGLELVHAALGYHAVHELDAVYYLHPLVKRYDRAESFSLKAQFIRGYTYK